MSELIEKKTRRSYSQDELDSIRSMIDERADIDEIAEAFNRNPATLKKKLIEEGIIQFRTEKQDEFEYRLASKIEQYWHDRGYYDVTVSQDMMGRPKSNLVNCMPRNMVKWNKRRND